ncbi:hypothetical protein Cni_G01322 [Canna indica]|uniref:B box-type domain-containing protein n=1 Tax=Canna indica TaxID=4628 RepID=A0AAQ3JMD1_9LILI|nr:hypothetical protein Cni_G01322 [Canna indica]
MPRNLQCDAICTDPADSRSHRLHVLTTDFYACDNLIGVERRWGRDRKMRETGWIEKHLGAERYCVGNICHKSGVEAISILSPAIKWKPAWLEALDSQKFFVSCSVHENTKKNEKNICCLDCCTSICPHCVSSHRRHRLLQVRRYVYHDVVRLEDLEKLIDCSNVQPYTINSSKVVFLKKRTQNRQFKGSGNVCTSCDRCLQEPFVHCSLGCKVDYLLRKKKDLSPYLRRCKTLQLSPDYFVPQADDDELNFDTTQSTIVEGDEHLNGSSDDSEKLTMSCTESTINRKGTNSWPYISINTARSITKNSTASGVQMSASNISRRKGVPQRSPLC